MKNESYVRQKIREGIIKALTEDDIEEVSASGAAGSYSTPMAFSAGRASDKKKAKSNYDNSGMTTFERTKEDSEDDTMEPAPLYEKSGQPITKDIIDRVDFKKNVSAIQRERPAPETPNNPVPLETDESSDDHQTAEEAHGTDQDTGKKGPGYLKASKKGKANLPEQSIQKNIVSALYEINKQLEVIRENINTTKQLKEGLGLDGTPMWKRTKHQMLRIEAHLINVARIIKELN